MNKRAGNFLLQARWCAAAEIIICMEDGHGNVRNQRKNGHLSPTTIIIIIIDSSDKNKRLLILGMIGRVKLDLLQPPGNRMHAGV
jgi:hypothetical protein